MPLAKSLLTRYREIMPVNSLSSEAKCYHVYNIGVEKRVIFNDAQDYESFEGYLREYLNPPADPESVKKVFTVNGRSFRGTPHQPKNFYGKINLLAYSLMPDHFHLLLKETAPEALEGFIRSLCTRYSMYFNKRYSRSGSLFQGPYKSVCLKNSSQILPLINYIHHGKNDYSSYPEYSGKRETLWVSTNIVLSSNSVKSEKSEKELLDGITLENETKQLERRDLAKNPVVTAKPKSRFPEISALVAGFLVLFGIGYRNVSISSSNYTASSSTSPEVLSGSVQPTPTNTPVSITMVVVDISDDIASVGFRMEPTTESLKIGEAKNGESFEFVSVNSGWYEVKLSDNQTGYINANFTHLEETIY